MVPGGKRNDTRSRLPCWILSSTGSSQHSTGSSLSYTSTMLESRQVGHVFKRIKVWIFMYNLLILMLATNFFSQKVYSGNEISTAIYCNQPSVFTGFYFSLRAGSAVGTERNLIHVCWFTKRYMHTKHADSLEKTLILGKIEGRRRSGRQRIR